MRWLILTSAFLLGSTACGSGVGMSWREIEDLGGLSIGSVKHLDDGRLQIQVLCNVAGVDSITVRPRTMNSGLGVTRVVAVVEDDLLLITVFAGPGASAQCTDVTVRYSGRFLRTAYRNPDRSQHDFGSVIMTGGAE
jgi:hypothetical protein